MNFQMWKLFSGSPGKIKCVYCYRPVLSTEVIRGNYRPFAITPKGEFFNVIIIFGTMTFSSVMKVYMGEVLETLTKTKNNINCKRIGKSQNDQ